MRSVCQGRGGARSASSTATASTTATACSPSASRVPDGPPSCTGSPEARSRRSARWVTTACSHPATRAAHRGGDGGLEEGPGAGGAVAVGHGQLAQVLGAAPSRSCRRARQPVPCLQHHGGVDHVLGGRAVVQPARPPRRRSRARRRSSRGSTGVPCSQPSASTASGSSTPDRHVATMRSATPSGTTPRAADAVASAASKRHMAVTRAAGDSACVIAAVVNPGSSCGPVIRRGRVRCVRAGPGARRAPRRWVVGSPPPRHRSGSASRSPRSPAHGSHRGAAR